MTIFVTFVMGAKEAYLFNSPTHWAWHNLPPDVEALFTKQPPIKDVVEYAQGDSGQYFISYRDHDGQVICNLGHYNLPNPLTEYLYHGHPHVIRDLATLSVNIGPYDSYYAHDKSSASWSNLPPALEKAVEHRVETQDAWKTVWKNGGGDAPSCVSLGADGSYFMRTVAGGGSWDLKSKEEGMVGTNKYLEEASNFQGIAGLYLFPHQPNSYILLLTSGKAFSNLPEYTWPDYNKMAPVLPPLTQSALPIPCMPQPRQQTSVTQPLQQNQPQQPQLQPNQQFRQQQPQYQLQQNSGCCPAGVQVIGAPHNCCPQMPLYPGYNLFNASPVFHAMLPSPYASPALSFSSANAKQGQYSGTPIGPNGYQRASKP